MNTIKQDTGSNQNLAGDELEHRILYEIQKAPTGKTVPQVAQAIGIPLQTVRYRMMQLTAARILREEWHRRFLFYYLNNAENKNIAALSENSTNGQQQRRR